MEVRNTLIITIYGSIVVAQCSIPQQDWDFIVVRVSLGLG